MIRLRELAENLGTPVRNVEGDPYVSRVSSISTANRDSLVFAEDAPSTASALGSGCGAVVIREEFAPDESRPALLISRNPRLDFARAARLLQGTLVEPCIHPSAVIDASALVDPTASVGPCAVVGRDVLVGSGTVIGASSVVGAGVAIGRNCRIHPRAVLYPGTVLGDRVIVHAGAVLGADGFGYVRDPATGEYLQFPQQGQLLIEDDVEIGANTTIDRGALEQTRIGRGTKLDNLVHIGHNCTIGRNVVIAAQTGISGSCTIGDGAVLGGQVGIGDHAGVGEGVILGGQAGVLPHKYLRGPGMAFWGTPAKPLKQYLRELALIARLKR